ncbi:MAG: hypothetical protein P4L73_19325 [Caulobacteraceae bacterium]|nr:hypothetical protein [Caulobacteraceae bacterium]
MAISILRRPMLVVAGSGWRKAFNFWTGPASARAPADLAGCSVVATLAPANTPAPAVLTLSTDNGLITIQGNAVIIDVGITAATAWATPFAPAACDFRLRIIDPAADVDRYVILSDPASSRVKVCL